MMFLFLLAKALLNLLIPLTFSLLVATIRAMTTANPLMSKVWLTVKAARPEVVVTIRARSVKVLPAVAPYVREVRLIENSKATQRLPGTDAEVVKRPDVILREIRPVFGIP